MREGGAPSPAVELRGLSRRYGRTMALDGLDLVVPAGQLYGLIGPNGAGKTTALRVALGLVSPDAGTARLFGVDPGLVTGGRPRRVGSLLSGPPLSPRATGREQLTLVAAWAGLPPSAVGRVVERLGLGRMSDRPVGAYSSGLRQILAVAAALLGEPELLVLDEPTVGLDPLVRRRVTRLLAAHAAAGGTVLMSSHELAEAEQLCTRVGLVAEGRLVAEGPPAELGPDAGRFELGCAQPDEALAVLRGAGLFAWRADGGLVVELPRGADGQRPDGDLITRALADAGLFPTELRRLPTLEAALERGTTVHVSG